MKRTPLHQWHRKNGAKLGGFAGWEMPFQYGHGAVHEHRLVRRSAGIFDTSHMGQLLVEGEEAAVFLDYVLSSDIRDLEVDHSRYGLLCREDGGVLDDVFTYRLPDRFLVVVNAANRDKDLVWMQTHVEGFRAGVRDVSDETAMLAVQGPRALQIVDGITEGKSSQIERFHVRNLDVAGIGCIVGRTGYTGEDGVELFLHADHAEKVWKAVLAEGERAGMEIGPAGLVARDSLRFEPGFPLYGHELDEETTPVEARLKWACHFEREFVGQAAIREELENGLRKKLITLKMEERGVPRQDYEVLNENGEPIGTVATGMYAPTLDWYYANAFVRPEFAKRDLSCAVDIRGRHKRAVVTKRPLYKPSYR